MDSSSAQATCPNCSTEITGPFCASCGQEQKELKKYVWTLAGDFFDDVFTPDSRASRSIFYLLFKPGFLTSEYFAGRRARYVPPVRLYLVISFLFFFVLPLLIQLAPDSVSQVRITGADTTEGNWRDEIDEDKDISNVHFGWLSEEENKELSAKLRLQLIKVLDQMDEDPASVFMEFMDLMSAVMFFLLPVFAVLLKFFYLGSGIYYAEHLLLAIHNHCFLYFALFLSSVLGFAESTSWGDVTALLEAILGLWMPIYIYFSMRQVYQQGHLVTFVKFLVLATSYWILAMTGFVFTVVAGIWMA